MSTYQCARTVFVGLATAATSYSSPSATFAINRGADYTLVYSAPLHVPPYSSFVDLRWNSGFSYDPAKGGLLVEVIVPPGSAYGGMFGTQWDNRGSTINKGACVNAVVCAARVHF